ncbi:MlaD family protein [Pleionea sp. CnH1-48]|uniref:MlaD family protein n=1 Tax=Pleionea sp. CnH1-48 TaxID=2954494 RepID=UPI0020969EB9|nr:MlaD family protein [Pleionea sp. CnH1-48]MCO7223475.1 MlaD family protein [Pleionea sp. CnH1-48]
MSQNTDNDIHTHEPNIQPKKGINLLWLLPIVAILISIWLVHKNLSTHGIMIQITFDSAVGLEEGKTKVMYKGLQGGIVKKLELTEDINYVIAHVEMIKEAEDSLTDKTLFWQVKPEISLSGVSGLETLLSGDYIAIRPDRTGIPQTEFVALKQPPPPDHSEDGLYLELVAEKVGSISTGSKVYYRQLEVGEVRNYFLSEDNKNIIFEVFIPERFTHLVSKESRFWNSSGITIRANLPNIEVKTESLASVIAGGISLSEPTTSNDEPVKDGDRYQLFDDFEAAEQSETLTFTLDSAAGLSVGTEIRWRQSRVGEISKIEFDQSLQQITATATYDPDVQPLITESTQFVLVQPSFSLQGVNHLDAFLSGNYIDIKPGKGKPRSKFPLIDSNDYLAQSGTGRLITLNAPSLGSVQTGSQVFFKHIRIGKVVNTALSEDFKSVDIKVMIDQRYSKLVNEFSRFYRSSGIQIKADWKSGLQVNAGSAQTILAGGISLVNAEKTPKETLNGSYRLFDDYQSATENGHLLRQVKGSRVVKLRSRTLHSVTHGAPVYYRKLKAGEVLNVALSKDNRSVDIELLIAPQYAHLVTQQSRFWNASGVQAKASLAGVSVTTESMLSIIDGGIGFDSPSAKAKRASTKKVFPLYETYDQAVEQSLSITIDFPKNQDLNIGSSLKYQGVKVGEVTKLSLRDEQGGIKVVAKLYQDGHFLAREGSLFWIADAKLGISQTEYLSNALFGSHIEIVSGEGAETRHFAGLLEKPNVKPEEGLNIRLVTAQLGSVGLDDPVYYRGVTVGKVTHYELSPQGDQVSIDVNIQAQYQHVVKSNSLFWNFSGVHAEFGLIDGFEMNTDSFEAILTGGIAFMTPREEFSGKAATELMEFPLYKKFNEKWEKLE